MERNAVKNHLVSFIRQRLAEKDLFISNESLEYTAERYAWQIMDDPKLSVSKLLDRDIARIRKIMLKVERETRAG